MTPHRKKKQIALALAAIAIPASAALADTKLSNIVVTATRYETEAANVPATVTSIGRDQMDRRLPANEADLFVDDPDLAVSRDARRFGATRPNIRGLEDNRVMQLVDGVRLTDYYNGGGPTNFTMSAPLSVVPDFLKRVEVLRGSSSSLYGSDAIGGVIGFLTLDPSDILATGEQSGGRVRASVLGANSERRLTALGAFRGDAGEFLIGVSSATAKETDGKGGDNTISATRTKANPQSIDDQGVLAKWIFQPAAGHKVTLGLEGRDQSIGTDVYRLSTSLPRVSWMQGDDNARRFRGSVEWEHKPENGLYDRLLARVYHQDAETRNHNDQRRTSTSASCSASAGGTNNCYIQQYFTFSQDTTGTSLQLEKMLKSGELTHLVTGGIDYSRQKTENFRDATVYNLTSGTSTKTLAGDIFPQRDFANGTTNTIGLFLQDEISGLAGGALSLTPGIRYDRRTLKPEPDALAQSVLTAIGRQVASKNDGSWSPKLGAMWRFTPAFAAYGQIARSFRAPNYNEVNGAFRNTVQSYGITPNPDLKPETGIGGEVGLKYQQGALRGQVALYDNRYKDFIDSVRLGCPGSPQCIPGIAVTYMSQNLSRVRIHGAELRGGWDFAPGWRADGSIAYAKGANEDTGAPINSVEPTRLSLIVARDAGHWGLEGRLRAASKKDQVDDSSGVWFRPPGYSVVDLSAWVKFNRNLRATVAISNLFDRKHWLWSDIRQADATRPAGVDFYSQPGRTLSFAIQADF